MPAIGKPQGERRPRLPGAFATQALATARAHRVAVGVGLLLVLASIPSALWLHQHFSGALAAQLRQLKFTVEAPGASTVRVYWDGRTAHPDRYVEVPVVEGGYQQTWNVRMEALPEKHPAARHDELWVFAVRTPEQTPSWKDITLSGKWAFQPDQTTRGMDRTVGVAMGSSPNQLSVTLQGSALTVVVGKGQYNGKLRIVVNGVSQVLDLYAEHWHLAELSFFPKAPPEYGARPHGLLIPKGQGYSNRLEFAADTGALDVQRVALDGIAVPKVAATAFESPRLRWPAHRVATLATAATCLLLLSTIGLGTALFLAGGGPPSRALRRQEYLTAASFALLMALVLTMLFYPGILNEDSIGRWKSSIAVVDQGAGVSSIGTWYPPLMTLAMMGIYRITGEIGLPTFLQAFLFYYCFGLFSIEILGRRRAIVLGALLALLPTIVVHAVFLSPDTLTAAALMALVVLISRRRGGSDPRRETPGLLFFLSCVMLFGFRYNSVALVPFLIGVLWIMYPSTRVRVGYAAMVLLAAAATRTVPRLIGAEQVPMSSLAFLWDHVGMLKQIDDREVTRRHQLDRIGDMSRAIAHYQAVAPDNLIHGEDAPFPAWTVLAHGKEVQAAFWRLARQHPGAFVASRLEMYRWLLGIPDHLYRIFYFDQSSLRLDPQRPADTKPYAFHYIRDPHSLAMRIEEANATFVDLPGVRLLFRPWFLLTILAALGLVALLLRLSMPAVALTASCGVAYYGTFFILGAGAAFRYYFPSYVLLLMAVLGCAADLGRHGLSVALARRQPPRQPSFERPSSRSSLSVGGM